MSVSVQEKNGRTSLFDKLWIVVTFIQLPIVIVFNLALSPWSARNKHKTALRVIGDTATRFVSSRLSLPQLQYYFGSSAKTYRVWTKQKKLPEVIDELDGGGRLLWIGNKQKDRVLLYCHGGGFVTCLSDFHLAFCRHVQTQLEMRYEGMRIGVAVLEYSLIPDALFPTQLSQLISAIRHLSSLGVSPDCLHLAGDSSGANLILQLLSHTLHPLPEDIIQPSPLINQSAKIRGIFLMSPWTSVTADFHSSEANEGLDWASRKTSGLMGHLVLEPVPQALRIYIEVAKAHEDWLKGVDNLVDRFLVASGEKECLFDPIATLVRMLSNYDPNLRVIVQAHGVHNDPLQDSFVGEKKPSEITEALIEWLAAGYK